jgi:hypothetical protein
VILQLHERGDFRDRLRFHAESRQLVLCLIECGLRHRYACTGDADQKGEIFRAGGGERHDPSRLAPSEQANLSGVDLAASLEELEGRHDIAGQIVE